MKKKLIFSICAIHLFCTTLWSTPLEQVSLQLKWKYQFQFAGFIMAKEKGFYKDVGLDVKLKEFNSSINVIDDVLNQKSTFGIDDSQLIYYRLQGKPLVGLMAIFQTSPVMLLALKESGLKNIKDLDGKKLEITSNSTYNISIKALLRAFNIKTLQQNPSFKVTNLINKKSDIIVAYDGNEPYQLKEQGYEPQTFLPQDYGFHFYGDILFTNEKTIQENPKLVKNFHDASKKGWEYAFNHIDETIDIILKKYNTQSRTEKAFQHEATILQKHSQISDNFSFITLDKVHAIAKSFAILFPQKYDLKILDNFIYSHNLGLQEDYTLVKKVTFTFFSILLLILIWLNILKKHNKKLEVIKNELDLLNNTLEQRIQTEVQKNREQEFMMLHQSRLAQMGEVINMIAHQWRQPLSSINALVMIMDMKISKQNLEDKLFLKKELDDIEMLTKHMSITIDDFRNFFLPEKEKVLFNIQDMSNNVTNLLQPILVYENIQIKIKHHNNIEFYGYQNEFGQVLINLLNNAKDALVENNTNKEKIIYLTTLQEEKKISISIHDNAGGVNEKIMNEIFEPYFSTKSEKKGTGLGLYMSKKIIEEHMEGRLFLTNSLDGAKFTVEFNLS